MNTNVNILTALGTFLVATQHHIRRLLYPSRYGDRITRRNLGGLERDGLITSFPLVAGRGRPQKIYSLNKARRKELQGLIGQENIHFLESKRFPIIHQLAVNSVIVAFVAACRGTPYICQYLTDLEGNYPGRRGGRVLEKREFLPLGGVSFVADGAICLVKGGKAILLVLECDMGSQSRHGHRSIEQKIMAYDQLWRSGGFKYYESLFLKQFNGFRLLWVTTNEERAVAVEDLSRKFDDLVWITTLQQVEQGVFEPIWKVQGAYRKVVKG